MAWLLGGLLQTSALAEAPSKDALDEVEQRISRVENGLVELMQTRRDETAPAPSMKTLAERMAFYKVPGLSMAVIHGNRIEWAKVCGEIKAGSGVRVSTDTLFQAASTTKALVAAAVLHQVEKGRLELDAEVNTYLKAWKVPENELTREKKVTLRMLLSHRAGLPSAPMCFDEKAGVPTLVQVLKGESPARNKAAVVEHVPGSKWQYSNVGYAVVQRVLEESLGQPLPRIMAQTLFEPLAMGSSTLSYPLPAELRPRAA